MLLLSGAPEPTTPHRHLVQIHLSPRNVRLTGAIHAYIAEKIMRLEGNAGEILVAHVVLVHDERAASGAYFCVSRSTWPSQARTSTPARRMATSTRQSTRSATSWLDSSANGERASSISGTSHRPRRAGNENQRPAC